MNKNKQLIVNMSANFITYVVTFGISFFLSPYIVESVGADAYGFIGLANNFISYASLISIAFNSMASRFITIKLHKNDIEGASKYFSSVFFTNTAITAVLFVVFASMFIFLEKMINIPEAIFWDVKILFAFLFINCLVSQLGSISSVATFATNKLYLSSIHSMGAQAIKIAIILPLFLVFVPKISYLGISTLICTIYTTGFNVYYSRKLLPNLRIKVKYFEFKAIRELFCSGIWNLITRLGSLLQDGLDLLITNLFINPIAMGVLSISKTLPSIISGVTGSMVGVFSPNFTQLYAEEKNGELIASVKQSIKIMGILVNIPIIVLVVCGEEFFGLWQPSQNAHQLYILALLACAGLVVVGGINCIYNVFTVVNKMKLNSLLVCFTGILNVVVVFVLLKTTNLGIYAIAGVSTALATVRNLVFTVPYGAYCLKLKWYSLYIDVLRSVVFVVVVSSIGYILKHFIPFGQGWGSLIILGIISVAISLVIGIFIMLDKDDRSFLIKKLKRKKV